MFLHTFCLGTSIIGIMYYTVLSGIDGFTWDMADIYWRGLCEKRNGMDPKKFCAEAGVFTLSQVTLSIPVLYIILFYLPTVLYVLIVNVKKCPKNMKVTEHFVLFILASFTNMLFTKPQPEDKTNKLAKINVRSSSLPNITSSADKLWRRTESCPSLSFKEEIKESFQPDFSLFHSNILYFIQFIGFVVMISFDIAIALKRENTIFVQQQILIAVLLVNFILWIDLNITILRKKSRITGALR